MSKSRWLLATPLAMALALAATLGSARASSIRDEAKLFSPEAIEKAEGELNRIEREAKITTTVETVDSLNGLSITDASLERAEKSGMHGLFVLIAKKEGKIDVYASSRFSQAINGSRRLQIQNAFISGLKRKDFDAGLLAGVRAVDSQVTAAKAEMAQPGRVGGPGRAGPPLRRGNPQGGFGLGSLLGIGLLIVGGLFLFRLLGSLFGGGGRGYAGQGNPMMGRPGYGAPGGGGGGFMSSLFGGIGGAMAGNWLYDQFSGRHQGGSGTMDSGSYGGDTPSSAPDTWAGGGDTGGGDWGGGGGGGDTGGGDWGGGGGGDTGGGDW